MSKNEQEQIKSGKAGYSNFKDPIGLAIRMIKSGDRTAYFTLFREVLSIFLTPVDFLLSKRENALLERKQKSELPIILVLGGSRSGTTLFYQTLAQYLSVSYFNNLSASFPKAPIISSLYFGRFLKKPKGNFKNYYGSVSGLNGPNDGFHIWNRWFGEDRNHVPESLSPKVLEDMGHFLNLWNVTFNKPLLNKNNRNSLCIKHFEEAYPGKVYYLHISRDPLYVIQSLIQSREMIQGDKTLAWGLGSEDAASEGSDKNEYKYIDDIARQVYQVENQITSDLADLVPEARRYKISYSDFCDTPANVLQDIHRLIFNNELEDESIVGLKPFKNTNRKKLPDEEFEQIKKTVEKYPFS